MNVLVTGGAGFIGSHVAEHYLQAGHDVAVIDDLSVGIRDSVPDGAAFDRIDIRDGAAVRDCIQRVDPDIINHHAAHNDAMESLEEPAVDAETNIQGSIHLLEAARQQDVSHVVYASSGGLSYGEPQELPTPEDHPMQPSYPYGISKHSVEHYLDLYQELYGLDFTVLRYASVYGPRATGGVIMNFLQAAARDEQPVIFGDGTQTRDFIHVEDIAAANLLAHTGSGYFNIGTCTETSITELWTLVQDVAGVETEPRHEDRWLGDIDRCRLDYSAAEEQLGWAPGIELADGIRQTWEVEHREGDDTGGR